MKKILIELSLVLVIFASTLFFSTAYAQEAKNLQEAFRVDPNAPVADKMETGVVQPLMFFIILNGLAFSSLYIAKKFSVFGANKSLQMGKSLMAWTPREVVGRGSRWLGEKSQDEEFRAKHPYRAALHQKLYDFGSNTKMGMAETFGKKTDAKVKLASEMKDRKNEAILMSTRTGFGGLRLQKKIGGKNFGITIPIFRVAGVSAHERSERLKQMGAEDMAKLKKEAEVLRGKSSGADRSDYDSLIKEIDRERSERFKGADKDKFEKTYKSESEKQEYKQNVETDKIGKTGNTTKDILKDSSSKFSAEDRDEMINKIKETGVSQVGKLATAIQARDDAGLSHTTVLVNALMRKGHTKGKDENGNDIDIPIENVQERFSKFLASEDMDADKLRNVRTVLEQLAQKDIATANVEEREAIMAAREALRVNKTKFAARGGVGQDVIEKLIAPPEANDNPTKRQARVAELNKLSGDQVINLPIEIILQPEIATSLESGQLGKVWEKMTRDQKTQMAEIIHNASDSTSPTIGSLKKAIDKKGYNPGWIAAGGEDEDEEDDYNT